MKLLFPFVALIVFCLPTLPLSAVTLSLPAIADTSLLELKPDHNLGGQSTIPGGTLGGSGGNTRCRILLRFDLTSVPAGATITAARLKTTVTKSPAGRVDSTFAIHQVLQEWGEGLQAGSNPGGAPGQNGEATWNQRLHGMADWGQPGGELGTDFGPDVLATVPVLGNDRYTAAFNATGLAVLNSWLGHDGQNNRGFVFLSQSEGDGKTARRFATRADETEAPTLEIDFETAPDPEPEVLELEGFGYDNDGFSVSVLTEVGKTYFLESREDLRNGEWAEVESKPGTGSLIAFLDEGSAFLRRFYRVGARNAVNQQDLP